MPILRAVPSWSLFAIGVVHLPTGVCNKDPDIEHLIESEEPVNLATSRACISEPAH